MCKTPIRIKNNSKYITENTGQPYYLWVNCGHCSECREQRQTEWNLRTYYQTLETITNGGWLYFDTLTYDNKYLPRLTNFIETTNNWACFDYKDIRDFYETLRGYYSDKAFKYFITSEYGTLRNRPHYHIILFVNDTNINELEFSKDVARAWKKGRTDGLPYKSAKYVKEHNIIKQMNLNAIRYVAKYVNKSPHFMDIINERWNKIEYYLQNHERHKYNKIQIKAIKRKYYYHCAPFHRQSQHYGESALLYMSINDLWEQGRLYYKDDTLKINKYCRLPMYFKRKLTQEQIKYNGKRIWINTKQGILWKQQQEHKIIEQITDRYKDLNFQKGNKYTDDQIVEVAKYILYRRGRINGEQLNKIDYKPHHKEATLFNYNTDKDQIYIGKQCISKEWAGNDKIGYCTTAITPTDIEDKIYINNELEAIIDDLKIIEDDKSRVLLKEHLTEIRKTIFKAL